MTPRRLLVLGAGGFLGTHVTAALGHAATMDVSIVSRTSADHRLDLATADRAAIAAVVAAARPDVIVNCAGVTSGALDALTRGNVALVADLVAAIAAEAPGARLVHLGSAAEYGAVPPGTPIREDAPTNPVGDYGMTKLAGTELVLAAGEIGDVDGVVLRVFNPIGAGSPGGSVMGRAAAGMRDAIASGAPSIHLGSLEDERDFIDVRDVADAVAAAAAAPDALGARILNVGSGRATSVRDAVARLAAIAGFLGEIIEDRPAIGGGRVPWQQADIGAARAALGWRPRRSLDESLEAVWAGAGRPAGVGGQASVR